MRLRLLTFFFLTYTVFAQAQTADSSGLNSLKLGEWRQHLPWQRSVFVTQSESKVFFATEWAVVEVDKADRDRRFITKVEGLSETGINLIRYNQAAKQLLIVYSNSNIDLWFPESGKIINFPYIQKNINIIGDKKIYAVTYDGEYAYLGTGFGFLKMNLARAEAEYTTFTNLPIYSFAVYDGYLYAGTSQGLYRLPANDDNPADFVRWQAYTADSTIPEKRAVTAMQVFNNKLYIGINRQLLEFDGQSARILATDPSRDVIYLTAEGEGLTIGWRKDFNGIIEYLDRTGARNAIHWTCQADNPIFAVEDGNQKFWISDYDDGFRFYNRLTDQCEIFNFNSPYNQKVNEIDISADGTTVYVTTPGAKGDLSPLFVRDGVYVFKNGVWTRWNRGTIPALIDGQDSDADMWRVAPNPSKDQVFVGSWVGGLLEFNEGSYTKKYTKENSILQSANESGANRTAIGGLAYDAEGNLWISNFNAGAPIAVLKSDGTLRNFPGSPSRPLMKLAVDKNGYKWFVIGFGGGILVYDSGADIDNPSDDRYRVLNSSNTALPVNTINDITVDLDGAVWVGTQQGAVVFECGSSLFNSEICVGRKPIVTVDDFNSYLLETEDVRTIAVDGANRKWFGTFSGVFVQSADGINQVAQYTSTNSPLLDNFVNDIAINPLNGEIWIGTEKGIVSVRGEATEGGRVNKPSAYAYPNPVRPDYEGPIAIYGLARDANIKITDVSGNLVYEGKALGGQAVWNGRDYFGRRAASGVYLIMATSSESFDTPDTIITKMVILN